MVYYYYIDMVSSVQRKTRAGVLGDINKSFESVTIADSKFSNRELVCLRFGAT